MSGDVRPDAAGGPVRDGGDVRSGAADGPGRGSGDVRTGAAGGPGRDGDGVRPDAAGGPTREGGSGREGVAATGPSAAACVLRRLELPILLLTPVVLGATSAARSFSAAPILTLGVAVLSVLELFASFEVSRPSLRQLMPTIVLGAVAAAGRMLFTPIMDFKPVSAIAILAGSVFGRQSGFMVGAMGALVSNFFFGQGPWTPWQMYSWGLVGYLGGVFAERGLMRNRRFVLVFGFLSGLLYGFILDTWNLAFVSPLTLPTVVLNYLYGLPHNLVHGTATVFFLAIIYAPWNRKLERIKRKYDLRSSMRYERAEHLRDMEKGSVR